MGLSGVPGLASFHRDQKSTKFPGACKVICTEAWAPVEGADSAVWGIYESRSWLSVYKGKEGHQGKRKRKKKGAMGLGGKRSLKNNVVFLSFILQISKQHAFVILLEYHPIKAYFSSIFCGTRRFEKKVFIVQTPRRSLFPLLDTWPFCKRRHLGKVCAWEIPWSGGLWQHCTPIQSAPGSCIPEVRHQMTQPGRKVPQTWRGLWESDGGVRNM